MNCKNCGGPLEVASSAMRGICPYCNAQQNLPEADASVDRVVSLRTVTSTRCPTCSIHMHKAALDGGEVRTCPTCHGLWVAADLFADVVRSRRAAYKGADVRPEPINPAELNARRECPVCEETMETHPYYGPGNAVIDACHRCHHVWLDMGELASIEAAPGRR